MAANPTYKITLEFTGPDFGFRELYYTQAPGVDAGQKNGEALATERAQMLGRAPGSILIPAGGKQPSFCLLSNVKAERVPEDGVPQFREMLTPPVNNSGPFSKIDIAMHWTGPLVSIKAGIAASRSLVMRGMPQTVVPSDWRRTVTDVQWIAQFNNFAAILTNGNWFLRSAHGAAPFTNPITSITAQAGTGYLLVQTPAANGLVTGNRITFYRVKARGACIRGTYTVQVIDSTHFVIPNYNLGSVTVTSGSYFVPNYQYNAITSVEQVRMAERPTGASPEQVRGRRRKCKVFRTA